MPDVIALGYHSISERWPAVLASTRRQLEQHLRLLLGRGYVPATFHEAVTAPPAPRTVAVTFDDAYRSVIDEAFPVLEDLGVRATVFAPTAFVGDERPMSWPGIDHWLGGEHEAELRCMSWEQLRELAEAGWEIGSHTDTHPALPTLGDSELAEELVRSRELCGERLGVPCRSLAYPYGEHDERVVAATEAAGFEAAATLQARHDNGDPLRFPRIGVYRVDDPWRFRAKVSPTLRRLRATRAGELISRWSAEPG